MTTDQLTERLYKILQKGKVFDFKSGLEFRKIVGVDNIPVNGIYIMFEVGEMINNYNRITRVGINKKKSLLDRLYKHCNGSIRNSIFRKHLFRILGSNEIAGEYIKKNMSFCVIADPESKREELEKKVISTITNSSLSAPSVKWLGKKSGTDKIKSSGLWNVQHVFSSFILDGDDLKYIEKNLIPK